MNAPAILGPDGRPMERARARTGSFEAASTTHPDLVNWRPGRVSAQAAVTAGRDRVIGRIQDLARNDGWASAAVTRLVDNIVGSGFRMSSKVSARALGLKDEDAAAELATALEVEWREYSDDVDAYCDAGRRFTVGMNAALAFRHRILDGEALGRLLWLDRGGRYATAIEVIDPARLSTPAGRRDGERMRDGVELGPHNEPLAYHIRASHPSDGLFGTGFDQRWVRVERETAWGRRVVLHAFEPDGAGQVRGKPVLAPIVRKLKQIVRYDEAELGAATLNAILAAFIESPMDPEMLASSLSGADLSDYQKERMRFYGENPLNLPGVQVTHLHHGEKATLTNPGHPNPVFEAFIRASLRNIASAVGLSYEQLTMDWSQTNYSSARAAILEVWRGLTARKNSFIAMWMMPIYAAFVEEAIEMGRVKLPRGAPAFLDRKNAYCTAKWIGPGRGWVDPLKEALGAEKRISAGFSTLEAEAAEQGGADWQENLAQRARELKELERLGLRVSDQPNMVIVYGDAEDREAA